MNDRQLHLPITLAGVSATVCGLVAVGLMVVCIVQASCVAGFLSTHFAVGSALFRVRSWLCGMSRREQNAFTLGQDSVRELHKSR